MNKQTQEALKMAIKWMEAGLWKPTTLEAVINACKEALEQPITRDWKETIDERIARDSEFKEALEQPAQKPVAYEKVEAWLIPRILDIYGARKTSLPKEAHDEFHGSVVWGAEVWCDLGYYVEDKNGVRHYAKPLYTHPAQPCQECESLKKKLAEANDELDFRSSVELRYE